MVMNYDPEARQEAPWEIGELWAGSAARKSAQSLGSPHSTPTVASIGARDDN